MFSIFKEVWDYENISKTPNRYYPRPGFLSLGTVDIWGRITVCCEGVFCACALVSSAPGLYPLETSNPATPKVSPIENHSCKILSKLHWHKKGTVLGHVFERKSMFDFWTTETKMGRTMASLWMSQAMPACIWCNRCGGVGCLPFSYGTCWLWKCALPVPRSSFWLWLRSIFVILNYFPQTSMHNSPLFFGLVSLLVK